MLEQEQADKNHEKVTDKVTKMHIEQWGNDNMYDKKVKDQAEEFKRILTNQDNRNERRGIYKRGFVNTKEFEQDNHYWRTTLVEG